LKDDVTQLFRNEVQTAQAAQWLGVVRIVRPLSYTWVTLCALGLAGTLVAFAAWGEVNRKSKVSGVLVPMGGSLNITAPQAGVVAQRPVAEGHTVQAGEVLMVLSTERQSVVGGTVGNTSALAAEQMEMRKQSLTTEHTLRTLQSQQREQVLADRIATIDAQTRQATEEANLLRSRIALARKTVDRYTHLAQEGFLPEIQLQTKQEELIDAQTRLQSLERARLALQQDRQMLAGERAALRHQLQSDIAQIARSQSSLTQELSENATRKNSVITAPEAPQRGG
jgi:membrane fusion protein